MSTRTIEPELDQPTPRRVRARGGLGTGCGLWFVRLFTLPHTITGVFLIGALAYQVAFYLLVLFAGTDVEGRVTKKTESKSKSGRTYHIAYTFEVDGAEYGGRLNVDADSYAAAEEGQAVEVRVFDPTRHEGSWPRIAGDNRLSEVGGAAFAAVFWNGILSMFLWQVYVRPWREWRLIRHGTATLGRVREVSPCTIGKNGAGLRIRYEYGNELLDAAGLQTGTVRVRQSEHPDVRAGDVLTVLYDLARPRRSLAYKFAAYRAVPPAGP